MLALTNSLWTKAGQQKAPARDIALEHGSKVPGTQETLGLPSHLSWGCIQGDPSPSRTLATHVLVFLRLPGSGQEPCFLTRELHLCVLPVFEPPSSPLGLAWPPYTELWHPQHCVPARQHPEVFRCLGLSLYSKYATRPQSQNFLNTLYTKGLLGGGWD